MLVSVNSVVTTVSSGNAVVNISYNNLSSNAVTVDSCSAKKDINSFGNVNSDNIIVVIRILLVAGPL